MVVLGSNGTEPNVRLHGNFEFFLAVLDGFSEINKGIKLAHVGEEYF